MDVKAISPAVISAAATPAAPSSAAPAPKKPGPVKDVTIGDVQGNGLKSPLEGQDVRVGGVVTAVHKGGFYIQAEKGEVAPASRGVWVFASDISKIAIGDKVTVSGTVQEFRFEKAKNDLTITEIASNTIVVVAHKLDLDKTIGTPRLIGKGGLTPPTSSGPEGIKFWEGVEGERVAMRDLLVVGATNSGTFYAVPDGGQWVTKLTSRGTLIMGDDNDVQPEVIAVRHVASNGVSTPQLKVGDRLPGVIVGNVGYDFGRYQLKVDSFPEVKEAPTPKFTPTLKGSATEMLMASINAENLDIGDGQVRFSRLANKIVNEYALPDVVALQEIQDDSGPQDDGATSGLKTGQAIVDAIAKAGGPQYRYIEVAPGNNQDGGEPGGNIRCAFLIREDRVELDEKSVRRIGEGDSSFVETRKALEMSVTFKPTGEKATLINVHNSAKRGGASPFGEKQPPPPDPAQTRRIGQLSVEQKRMVELAKDGRRVVLVGDHNETPEETVKHTEASLRSKIENVSIKQPADSARSYIFSGSAQTIDQVQVSVGTKVKLEIDDTNPRLPDKHPDRDSDHGHFLALVDMRKSAAVGKKRRAA